MHQISRRARDGDFVGVVDGRRGAASAAARAHEGDCDEGGRAGRSHRGTMNAQRKLLVCLFEARNAERQNRGEREYQKRSRRRRCVRGDSTRGQKIRGSWNRDHQGHGGSGRGRDCRVWRKLAGNSGGRSGAGKLNGWGRVPYLRNGQLIAGGAARAGGCSAGRRSTEGKIAGTENGENQGVCCAGDWIGDGYGKRAAASDGGSGDAGG